MITNFQPTDPFMSAEIARLTTKNDELENKIELGQQGSAGLIYQLISEIAGANVRLEMQKLQLTSSNTLLENEIIQFKENHEKDVCHLFAAIKREIDLVVAKVQTIVEKCIYYQKHEDFAISSVSVDLLKVLAVDIAKCNDDVINTYPQYEDLRKDHLISSLQLAIFPVSAGLTLAKIEPAMTPFIEDSQQKYETLKIEVTSIEKNCQSLIDKKEMMVDFHLKYSEKIKTEQVLCKKILELVNSVYSNIKWDSLLTVNSSSNKLKHMSGYTTSIVHRRLQIIANGKSEKMKERMGFIITNLQFQLNLDGVKNDK